MINFKITNEHKISEFDVEYKDENKKIPVPYHYEAKLK